MAPSTSRYLMWVTDRLYWTLNEKVKKLQRREKNQSKSDRVWKNNKTWGPINEKLWVTCTKKKVEPMIAHRGWWLVWSLNKASRWRYEWRWRSWRGVEASTPIKKPVTEMRKTITFVFFVSNIPLLLMLIFPWLNMLPSVSIFKLLLKILK